MKLRQIDIIGFKSFRDRMTVKLSDGMTAIVGPNGCGKSNVVDALKWAMGDMSAKSLRGQTMEDVIFAGSEARRAAGLAEVTLTFENDGVWGEGASDDEIDWGDAVPRELREVAEIAVTRRLHRSGESEYLINRTPCRLLDIQNLLAGTGVGKQGYSIIEQNRVGFIVSAKPEQRRSLIEEASGITRYQGQRERAEKKLLRTEENLQRLDDVLREVDKQIVSLERQARKAAQHRTLLDELRALEVALLVARRDELSSERALVVEQMEQIDAQVEVTRTIIAKHGESLRSLKVEAFTAEKSHAESTEAFYRLDTTLNLARSRVEHATVALQDTHRRLGSAEREQQQQVTRIAELERELVDVRAQLEQMPDVLALDATLQEREAQLAAKQQAAQQARNRRAEIQRAIDESSAQVTRSTDRREMFERRRIELTLREEALQATVEQATTECEKYRSEVATLRDAVAQLRERLGASTEREASLREARAAKVAARTEAERALAEARRQHTDTQTRLKALRDVVGNGDSYSDALRRVLDAAKDDARVYGTLADHLVVAAEEEQAMSNFLEARLLDVLVDDLDVARELLMKVQAAGKLEGRVAFQALGGKSTTEFVAALRDAFKADDVFPDAAHVSGGQRLVAGTSSTQALLAQRRQVLQLDEALVARAAAVEQADEVAQVATREAREGDQRAELARRETEALSLELRSREQQLQLEERQLERVDRAAQSARAEIVPVLRARDDLGAERDENEAHLAAAKQRFEEASAKRAELSHSDDDLQAEVEALRATVTEAKIVAAQTRERRRSLTDTLSRSERALESSRQLLEKYQTERTQLSEKIVELQKTITDSEAELNGAQAQRDDAKNKADAARTKLDAANKQVAAIEFKVRDARRDIDKRTESRQQLEFRSREISMSIGHIDEQLRDRYDLDVPVARRLADAIETPPAERRGKRDYLKQRIDGLGPVNAMAEEEYAAAQERHGFLNDQKEDLESAIADLRQAISKMDRESRRRFKETFDAVNAKFQTIFPELFRGGRAELVLTNPDDLLATGVEIVAQPPGKRLQSMTLLSGGEKALTAVSLIFSIFLLKPTPFSILDEVDAPLDEANVGRFARMVKRLSSTSQMIVITHSRRTMEASDMLYGVTMEEAGVSKLVNVRLSELDGQLAS